MLVTLLGIVTLTIAAILLPPVRPAALVRADDPHLAGGRRGGEAEVLACGEFRIAIS